MDRKCVQTVCTEKELLYYDGRRRRVCFNQLEVPFPTGHLIVSRTDPQGIITHCNQTFVDMSGYTRDELIGQPHHILRHPDMPKAAYHDLWQTLQQGKTWNGYIKNLRKDGSFYWVYATIIPNIRLNQVVGYTSVRRQPSRRKIADTLLYYAQLQLLEAEQCLT